MRPARAGSRRERATRLAPTHEQRCRHRGYGWWRTACPLRRTVLLLAGPGDNTDIVANFLASRVPDLVVVMESPPSRLRMARARARRVGWLSAVGQVLFVVVLQPVLRRRGARAEPPSWPLPRST